MTIEEKFANFVSQKLNLTKLCDKCTGSNNKCDICKVSTAHKELSEILIEKLKIKQTDDEETKPSTFLTGSYARHTIIRPPKDVDFFVVLDNQSYQDEELEDLITARKLLDKLEDVLGKIAEDKGLTIKRHRHSITIIYDENFSIDVIPAFETSDEKAYLIPDDKTGKYLISNPKIHFEVVNDLNKKTEKISGVKRFKRIVRIIKSMKRDIFNGGKLKLRSFHLELVAVEIFNDGKIESYSVGLEKFLSGVVGYLSEPGLKDPANEDNLIDDYYIDLSDNDKDEIIEIFKDLAKKASEALVKENNDEIEDAIKLWAEIIPSFGEFIDETKSASSLSKLIEKGNIAVGSSSMAINTSNGSESRKIPISPSWGQSK